MVQLCGLRKYLSSHDKSHLQFITVNKKEEVVEKKNSTAPLCSNPFWFPWKAYVNAIRILLLWKS